MLTTVENMYIDFQNSFTIDSREKNAMTPCLWQRSLPKNVHYVYHYLVKYEIQNTGLQFIQRMTSSSLTQIWLSTNAFREMCVMLKVYVWNVPPAAMQSCTIPWLQCQSLADQDRLTLTAPHALPQLFHVLDLILLNAVLQNFPRHSRWALDMDRLLDSRRECGINVWRLRLPVLDVLGPCPAGNWSIQNI